MSRFRWSRRRSRRQARVSIMVTDSAPPALARHLSCLYLRYLGRCTLAGLISLALSDCVVVSVFAGRVVRASSIDPCEAPCLERVEVACVDCTCSIPTARCSELTRATSIVTSGLAATRPFDFSHLGALLEPSPGAIIDLAQSGELPDLTGRAVMVAGLGRTVGPQPRPPASSHRSLLAVWKMVLLEPVAAEVKALDEPAAVRRGVVGGWSMPSHAGRQPGQRRARETRAGRRGQDLTTSPSQSDRAASCRLVPRNVVAASSEKLTAVGDSGEAARASANSLHRARGRRRGLAAISRSGVAPRGSRPVAGRPPTARAAGRAGSTRSLLTRHQHQRIDMCPSI